MSLTTNGYEGTYDGQAHSGIVTTNVTGAKIEYKTAGILSTWSDKVPTVTDVNGTGLSVQVRASKSGYVTTAEQTMVLKVNPATLTVTTNSASKTYDGNALTAGGSISGFVNDELAALIVTGSQTAVGSSTNGYSIDWENSDTAKESNYTIVENLGTLTVNQQGGGSSTETTTTTTTTTETAAPAVLGATRTITEEPAVLGATRDTEETPAVLGATRNPSTGDATNGAARALVIIICAGAVGFLASTKRKKNGKN